MTKTERDNDPPYIPCWTVVPLSEWEDADGIEAPDNQKRDQHKGDAFWWFMTAFILVATYEFIKDFLP